MFKESLLSNQLQNDPFEIIYNFRAKLIRPKAKYVRKLPKNNTHKVDQQPKHIQQYNNQRKMTADSDIQQELEQAANQQPKIYQYFDELLSPDMGLAQEVCNCESFFFSKQLQMAIPLNQLQQMNERGCRRRKGSKDEILVWMCDNQLQFLQD